MNMFSDLVIVLCLDLSALMVARLLFFLFFFFFLTKMNKYYENQCINCAHIVPNLVTGTVFLYHHLYL